MNIESLTPKLLNIKDYLSKHAVILFILLVVSVFGFMVIRIYLLSSAEPTSNQVDEKLSTYRIVKLDTKIVELFRSLEDRNISIESLFDNGRTNPFE
jgi:hypothetical protein